MIDAIVRLVRFNDKTFFVFRYPSTRLGRLARCASLLDSLKYCNIAYDYEIPEFFFDRNSDNFLAILGKKSLWKIEMALW